MGLGSRSARLPSLVAAERDGGEHSPDGGCHHDGASRRRREVHGEWHYYRRRF
uniref:Uncharacterized protein n=1 Tax=Setaria italica TaxID=4555 RepID=K4AP90_SETIT